MTIPAVQRLSFVVTLPAITMEMEHHRFAPGPNWTLVLGLGGRKLAHSGWVPKGTW